MSVQVTIADRVATVTIEREHRRNAVDNEALEQLIAAFEGFRRQEVTVAILSGKGTKSFCAGSDLKAVAEYSEKDTQHHTYLLQKCCETIDECPVTTIAAIEGFCLGGGLEMALACDYRLASADAQFGFPEITFHVLPTGGATVRLPRAIGLSRAREMLLFGFRIDAQKAMAWNLVSEIVAPGTTSEKAMEMARPYAQSVQPLSIALMKKLLIDGYGTNARVGHSMAYIVDVALSQTAAFKEGVGETANKKK
ncbi:enoyl-CoA hydratase [soil metagenome]